ncbi:ribonuclease P protein subunit p21 [Engraulis encrasicolus]|uniref:ribonuclease P protein subunit p21 n=1 Tax=Engraulis encrasicolus TaxID=184585 RepID=UPI002FD278B9
MAGGIKDKEAYQRLNFLYQAAHCVLAQSPENEELARFYCHTQKTIARRLVLRQDPSVKRSVCQRCCGLLVPGVTATVRQRKRRGRRSATVLRCVSCGYTRKLLNNPQHQLWVDRPEAQLENQTDEGAGTKAAPGPPKPTSAHGPLKATSAPGPQKPPSTSTSQKPSAVENT